jgi:pullulanase-type alpha-1,6-glucosidase
MLTLLPAALSPVLAQRPAAAAAPSTPSTLPRLGDCNASSHQTLLQPAPAAAVPLLAEARGLWLDDRRLRWPGRSAAPGTRFRLLHAADGQIVPTPGAPALNADGALTLDVFEGPLPDSVRQRFAWAGEGVTLTVSAADAPRLPLLLRRQLVLVQEDDAGRVLQATALQAAGALDALYRPAADVPDLGATVLRRGAEPRTGFKLWAPTAERVALCLYDRGSGPAAQIVPMTRESATGVWQAQRPGDLSGRYYSYLVDVHVRGQGRVRNLVTDPYALSLGAESRRGYIADLDSAALKPEGWDRTPRPAPLADNAEMVIYELHVRDFSIGDNTVPAAQRGKYGAFTATDSAGMRHLRALKAAGLTDVHLLPVFDLATVPDQGCVTPDRARLAALPPASPEQQALVMASADRDCFNWGYDPFHFTAPEGSFASDAADGAVRIREFRRMVQALHRQGLRVGMDVVYNHTTASGQHARSVLDRIVPGYYQRLDAAGKVETSTCCDNTATEHRMMAKLMIDSAVVWARDHRIDSFRFDLMGHQPKAAMLQLQAQVDLAAGRRVQLIGEGWNFGEVANGARFEQASQLSLPGSGIATFSDRARDAIRGGSASDNGLAQIVNQGWISGLHFAPNAQAAAQPRPATREDLLRAADLVRVGLAGTLRDYAMEDHRGQRVTLAQIPYAGQPAGYTAAPGEAVNYVENHDNQTLFDALAFKLPAGTSREDRARVQTLGTALVLFSQGVAYLHAGQEILRSKSLDRNSYDSGDWFNRLDWTLTDNGFGAGLPPERDNRDSWPHMAPLLADPGIKPAPEHIRFTRDAALDLLRIRASSSLFRLRTADEVRRRLNFHHTGPAQSGQVVVGRLSGMDHPGAGFVEMLYAVNVAPEPQVVPLPELRGRAYVLHPVHRAATAADPRPREAARWEGESGTLTVPARTALVYVLEGP